MSCILLPVDFSLACHNAYRYSLHLAKKMKLDIVLVHYYSGAIDSGTKFEIGEDGTIGASQLKRMRQFAYSTEEGASYPLCEPPSGVNLTYESGLSLRPSAAITERAKQPDISLVVMATRSSDSLLGKWLGSTASTVSETCERPVYLVPPHARYRPFRRMVVANNRTLAGTYPLRQLHDLADLYAASVHMVHVQLPRSGSFPRSVARTAEGGVKPAGSGGNRDFKVITLEATDISRGLIEYADTIGADLLVTINQPRQWWQAALQATLTQDLGSRSRLPVLVLHAAPVKGKTVDAVAKYAETPEA